MEKLCMVAMREFINVQKCIIQKLETQVSKMKSEIKSMRAPTGDNHTTTETLKKKKFACVRCRKMKTKCSVGKPCKNCVHRGLKCEYNIY